ncbi:MAG: Smr/MutS family protein [Pseudomonadales bacterium]|nr:Smr/MutS family protein [Pseudomonadales bacterium]
MSDVTPITTDRVQLKNKKQPDANAIRHNRRTATEHRISEFDPTSSLAESVDASETLSFHRSGVQPKIMQRLKNGEIPCQDEIDLHGYRANIATAELEGFMQHAISNKQRCVLIIHGKAEHKTGSPPVIKNLLNQWLPEQPEVLAFHSAPPRLGGTGALLVLLKRGR